MPISSSRHNCHQQKINQGLFDVCYNSNYLDDQQIDQLGTSEHSVYQLTCHPLLLILEKNIEVFMAFYRTTFPHATVIPKMHLLESHVRRWHLGFGRMGEQGAKSIHACFNNIERSFACMIHNRVEQLCSVMKEHHLRIAPDNIRSKKKHQNDTVLYHPTVTSSSISNYNNLQPHIPCFKKM